jgi:hypothetical protein
MLWNPMRPTRVLWAGLLAATVCRGVVPLAASEVPVARRSARAEAVLAPGGVAIARIDYGRPALNGRAIFGALVPWREIWRLGDDEATRLVTEVPLRLGGVTLVAGEYALFAEPSPERWRLVINRVGRQWGAYNYDKKFDAGRTDLAVTTTEKPIENLSIVWEPTVAGEGRLWFGWEKTVLSVAVSWQPAPPEPATGESANAAPPEPSERPAARPRRAASRSAG